MSRTTFSGPVVSLGGFVPPVVTTAQLPPPATVPPGTLYSVDDGAGATLVINSGTAWTPVAASSAAVTVATSRDITAADNGASLRPAAGVTLTIPAGLTPPPSFTVDCPATGTASIAVSGGASINGAATTLTRTRAANPVGFVVLAHAETDSYGVSGQ